MTKYTVTWHPRAERRLGEIWLEAGDKASVTIAANAIESILARSPTTAGESREPPFRRLIEPPLMVLFAVSELDRKVVVRHVKRSSP